MSTSTLSQKEFEAMKERVSSFATKGLHNISMLVRAIDDRLRNAAENKEGDYPEHVINDLYATWYLFGLLEKEFPDSLSEEIDIVLYESERKPDHKLK